MKMSLIFKQANYILRALPALVLLLAGQCVAQMSYTFTNAGTSGNTGPAQGAVNTAYQLPNSLSGQVTVVTQGIQEWAVPVSGSYGIEAYGAQGYGANGVGGRGAKMYGEFNLTAGQVLRILVGQQGELPASASYNAQYGGGGGSFVTDNTNNPLVVAGGGGGNWAAGFSTISDAPVTTSGNNSGGMGSTTSSGGINGQGGGTANLADGGAGFNGNGLGTAGGIAFLNGGNGGLTTSGIGGFGGGGGTSSFNNRRGGGGGGYSGGGAAEGVTSGFPEAGGGGSYNSGTNQNNLAGVNTGMGRVIITRLCNVNVNAATNPVCLGSAVTLSTNAVTTLSWSPVGPSSSSSIAVTPTATTAYSVTGTGSTGCIATAVIIVTVMPLPQIYAATIPSVLCAGKAATLIAYGANSYSWGPNVNGTLTTVSPTVSTVYTFTGTNSMGCKNTGTIGVTVNENTISAQANSPVCSGSPVNLSAAGATSYTWSTGAPFQMTTVYPSSTTIYSVAATDMIGCMATTTVMVTVNQSPPVNASADKPLVCRGEPVTLTATGASTYSWSNSSTGASITLSLPIDVTYNFSVTGLGTNGCSSTAAVSVIVARCTGIDEQNGNVVYSIWPNPTSGIVNMEFANSSPKTVQLLDLTGRILLTEKSTDLNNFLDLSAFSEGVYFIRVSGEGSVSVNKVVKQ